MTKIFFLKKAEEFVHQLYASIFFLKKTGKRGLDSLASLEKVRVRLHI